MASFGLLCPAAACPAVARPAAARPAAARPAAARPAACACRRFRPLLPVLPVHACTGQAPLARLQVSASVCMRVLATNHRELRSASC